MTEESFNSCQLPTEKSSGDFVNSLPSWMPIGYDSKKIAPVWEYECQQCSKTFEVPVPSSPTEEHEISCPICGNKDIKRLTLFGYEPFHCG